MDFVYSFGLGFVFIMGIVFGMMVFSILRGRDKKNTEFNERLVKHWDDMYTLQRKQNELLWEQKQSVERIADKMAKALELFERIETKADEQRKD